LATSDVFGARREGQRLHASQHVLTRDEVERAIRTLPDLEKANFSVMGVIREACSADARFTFNSSQQQQRKMR
jgi:hypothetical protein